MITNVETELQVYSAANNDKLLLTIPGDDVLEPEFSERIGSRIDSGSISLFNDHGEYTDRIRSGDKVALEVQYGGSPISDWGEGSWLDGQWPGTRYLWTALVRDVTLERVSYKQSRVHLDAEDFVYGVMGQRTVHDAYRNTPLNAVLTQIVQDNAPEIVPTVADELDTEVTIAFDGDSLYDAVEEVTTSASAVTRGYRNQLVIKPFEAPRSEFTVTDLDVGPVSKEIHDDGIVNNVRVDGARSRAIDEGASTDQVSEFVQIDANSRDQYQIQTRKSEVDAIELYLDRGSEENMEVRLQQDRDGEPVAPSDRSSDIASRNLSHEFLAQGDWSEFQFPQHTLPEPNPWLLIEADGEHTYGVDESGEPSIHVFYPYPVSVEEQHAGSVRQHRKRDGKITADGSSAAEARARAESEITGNALPEVMMDVTAQSRRMAMLRPGQVVTFAFDRDSITGEWIVIERTETHTGSTIDVELTMQEIASVHA